MKDKTNKARKHIPRDTGDAGLLERQKLIEDMDVDIEWVKRDPYPADIVSGNIENYIGTVSIPIGIAGPILIHGEYARGSFYVPLATTEGTLVASFNRGMSIIGQCGGCRTQIFDEGMQRAPVFCFKSLQGAVKFTDWVKNSDEIFKKIALSSSNYCTLKHVEIYNFGRNVFLRFSFFTGDATGQNMVNKAVYLICDYIQNNYPEWEEVDIFHLASNMCTDKKVSQVNILQSRGKKVTAEITIPHDIIHQKLRTTVGHLESLYHTGVISTVYAGSGSYGIHAANGITALFIACGQDVANVVESHIDLLDVKVVEGGLYVGVTLPSLIVGTVGGGTNLPTQRECLNILGCKGTGKNRKFAEITAATVLAGELSLFGAIASFEWIMAHERLGRNKE